MDESVKQEVSSLLLLRKLYQRFLRGEVEYSLLTNSLMAHCHIYGKDPLEVASNL
ncbi:hypothetical protein [Bacillus phage PK16]|nr:hypothetical protein [Bacillus phage PK16]AUM58886.1 hypothetical protein BCP01_085 [Bacillus phage BCP01]